MRSGFADRSQANLPDRHRALSTVGVFCAERLLELARPGVVFAVASGALLLLNLWRLLSGQVPDDQLVQTSGSEDVATLPDMQLDRAALPSRKPPSH